MKTVFVTGAGGGMGFESFRQMLPDIGEKLAIDVLIEIGVLEIMTVERRYHIEVIHIHGEVAVAVDAVELREIVGKHHGHLESTLLKVGRQFFLMVLVIKLRRHDMVLEIPVTPVKFLI